MHHAAHLKKEGGETFPLLFSHLEFLRGSRQASTGALTREEEHIRKIFIGDTSIKCDVNLEGTGKITIILLLLK